LFLKTWIQGKYTVLQRLLQTTPKDEYGEPARAPKEKHQESRDCTRRLENQEVGWKEKKGKEKEKKRKEREKGLCQ